MTDDTLDLRQYQLSCFVARIRAIRPTTAKVSELPKVSKSRGQSAHSIMHGESCNSSHHTAEKTKANAEVTVGLCRFRSCATQNNVGCVRVGAVPHLGYILRDHTWI